MKFAERVVAVAGGTGGLGRAVTLAFLAEGANVITTFRDPTEMAALRDSAGANGSHGNGSLEGVPVDLTEETAVRQFLDTTFQKYGRLDVLVNTVGGYAGGPKLWESELKVFDQMLALNLRAGLLLLRAAIPLMLPQKRGALVNVASKASLDHAAGQAAYAASKAGALALMDSLAEEVRGTGIRVNSVLPSIIDTAANRKAMPGADFAKWPKPEDIARVILFLCSDEAKVIHGAALPVYGAD